MVSPTTSPRPVTMLNTPAGIRAACSASVIICVCQALISLGLITAVQPEAIAVASLLQIKPASLFHGVIRPATPTGVITTVARPTRSSKLNCFSAQRIVWAGQAAIQFARADGAPYSVISASSRSASRARTARYILSSTAMRSSRVVRDQAGKASFAATMARRVSSSSARRTWPITASVAGLNRSKSSLPCGVTNSPLI